MKVLIVDDEKPARDRLRQLLDELLEPSPVDLHAPLRSLHGYLALDEIVRDVKPLGGMLQPIRKGGRPLEELFKLPRVAVDPLDLDQPREHLDPAGAVDLLSVCQLHDHPLASSLILSASCLVAHQPSPGSSS